MNPDRDTEAAVDRKRVIVKLYCPGCSHLVFGTVAADKRVVTQQRSRCVRQNLVRDVLEFLGIDVENGRRNLVAVPHFLEHGVDFDNRAAT